MKVHALENISTKILEINVLTRLKCKSCARVKIVVKKDWIVKKSFQKLKNVEKKNTKKIKNV